MNVIEGSHILSKVVASRFKEKGKKGGEVEKCVKLIILEFVGDIAKDKDIFKRVSIMEGVVKKKRKTRCVKLRPKGMMLTMG